MLSAGWTRYAALRDAGRRTLADPDTDEIVSLHAHRVTPTHEPRVELLLDGTPVHRFDFRLELALVVEGVSAVVRSGRLVAVRGGSCTGHLSLFLSGALLKHKECTWDPDLLVDLRTPLTLWGQQDRSPA